MISRVAVRSALLASAALAFAQPVFAAQAADPQKDGPPSSEPARTSSNPSQPGGPPPKAAPSSEVDLGEIVVTGIPAALQNALDIRRKADVILDGISADDIGSTPDLNLGEALQRIPGVQINRSADRRNATISVRGLPSQFTKTTVMGQSIATPTLGTRGNGNPFGIFDAALFSGTDVIKSFTAEIPAGGLASNVDLRLRSALERREGLVARAELQYEETTEKANPGYFLSATKRLGDSLAVYATGSYSDQNFRRDTIRVNAYTAFPQARVDQLAVADPTFKIAATDAAGVRNEVVYPSEVRQISQTNSGYRLSGGAGMAWKASDALTLRLDGIYTRRNLSKANLDILVAIASDITGVVTPLTGPTFVGQFDRGSNGTIENVYVANRVKASDLNLPIGNRGFPSDDQTWAAYPQLNFKNNDWAIDLVGTVSKAKGERLELLYQYQPSPNTVRADANNDGIDDQTNGTIATIDTGLGNYKNFLFDLTVPSRLLSTFGPYAISGGNGTQARNGIRPDNVVFTASGAGNRVSRDLLSADLRFERFVEFGPFTSIKAGALISKEKATQIYQENATLGTQLNNLGNDIFKLNDAVTSGANFFGNGAPGAERDGFLSLDIANIEKAIYPILTTVPEGTTFTMTAAQLATFFPELTPAARARIDFAKILALSPRNPLTGFIPRFPFSRVAGQNFTSDRTNIEPFLMTKFDLSEWANMPVRGNAGLRYVRAKLSGLIDDQGLNFYKALGFTQADFRPGYFLPPEPAKGTYSAWLPSVNVIYDVSDKIVIRSAYYETFEAFDLAEFSPAPTRILEDVDPDTGEAVSSTRIDVNRFGLKPRSSTAFDAGVSWYNRPGSVVSLGYFYKEVSNDIVTLNNFCPAGQSFEVEGETFGPLFIDSAGRCRIQRGQAVETNNPRIVINQIINNPNKIKVNGLEFQVQQRFDFLPGLLSNTGGIFNYTRVRSSGEGGTQLYNVANDIYNVIAYYEDSHFQARVAYNHASKIRLEGGGTFTGSSSLVRPRGQLDLSMAYKPVKWAEVRLELYNLTNSRREEYEGSTKLNRVADFDGRTGSLGVTVIF